MMCILWCYNVRKRTRQAAGSFLNKRLKTGEDVYKRQPLHKGKALLADFIIDIAIQIVFLLIQFAYMYFILDVSFGSQLGYVFLMMVLGAFAGNAFGILIGSITSKIPPDGKTGIMTCLLYTSRLPEKSSTRSFVPVMSIC